MSTRLRRGEREEYHFDLSAVRQLLHSVSIFRVVLKQDRHLECRCLWGPPHKRKRGKFKYIENIPQTHRLNLKYLRQCAKFHYNVTCSWNTSFPTFSNSDFEFSPKMFCPCKYTQMSTLIYTDKHTFTHLVYTETSIFKFVFAQTSRKITFWYITDTEHTELYLIFLS